MKPYYQDDSVTLHHGDSLDILATLPDASVDSVVCDPPYGLSNTDPAHVTETITRWINGERDYLPGGTGFMGKAWDAFVPPVAIWDDCLRVLKPGGHAVVFAGSRTVDLMTLGLRLAGFEIRDSIAWLYGSGFPKSLDVSKAIDKAAGAERPTYERAAFGGTFSDDNGTTYGTAIDSTPLTPEAQQWQGWGTALKPGHEPIVVARKPIVGTVAANVQKWGSGAINIGGCRIGPTSSGANSGSSKARSDWCPVHGLPDLREADEETSIGRRPGETARDLQPAMSKQDDVEAKEPSLQRRGLEGLALRIPEDGNGAHVAGGSGTSAESPTPGGFRAPNGHGPEDRKTSAEVRDGASHQRNQGRQSARESTSDGLGRPLPRASSNRAGTDHAEVAEPTAYSCSCSADAAVTAGRWPANVVLDDDTAAALDQQSGHQKDGLAIRRNRADGTEQAVNGIYGSKLRGPEPDQTYGGGGGASRFFYTAKAGADERIVHNGTAHPTVKPLSLMRWLVRLVTPAGGVILDPFAGSGTTVEAAILGGFRCIAVEREADYLPLITQRIHRRRDPVAYLTAAREDLGLFGDDDEGDAERIRDQYQQKEEAG